MSEAIVRIDGIGKRYKIGTHRQGRHMTLRSALTAAPRQALMRLRGGHTRTEEFWALRDINLEIAQGDVVGLIGRNGAGKSTLLKILSRIVEPTTGRAILDGRVSSLLEVGTGFHDELTGRENIYLNGAILGMRRREIQARFDEIVAFSEIEKFLDTPVKFYSSGMYVRLAFAIAAHLEPDILIVDEVLAVGDAEFQKKSLGKMSSVARSGRTVIFVSHYTTALLDLCDHGVLLESGRVTRTGPIDDVVAAYAQDNADGGSGRFTRTAFDSATQLLTAAELLNNAGETTAVFSYGTPLRLRIETSAAARQGFGLELRVKNTLRQPIAYASSWISRGERFRAGDTIEVELPPLAFAEGMYILDLICRDPGLAHLDLWQEDVTFTVVDARPGGLPTNLRAADELGCVVLEEARFQVL
jgi:homopolymeric O-antigen transport system ATP-binding protein